MPVIKLETFAGSHYEMGVQQGKAVRELVRRTLDDVPNFIEMKLIKPKAMPMQLFLWLARSYATKSMQKDIEHCYPRQAERLKGIAEGLGVELPWVFFAHMMEIKIDFGSVVRIPACTSIGLCPGRTVASEAVIGKNFDYPNHFSPLIATFRTKPSDGNRTLGCTMAPIAGMLDGMNEHGLAVTYNYAFATEKPRCNAPTSIMLQEMLETCSDVEEAVEFLSKARHAGNALLMLGDRGGAIKSVEVSHNHTATRDAQGGLIINTNHYFTEEMQRRELPRSAILSEKVGEEWANHRLFETSEERLKRAEELLDGRFGLGEESLVAILRDHGKDGKPSSLTICNHSGYLGTLRSIILYPKRGMLKAAAGSPCQSEFFPLTF